MGKVKLVMRPMMQKSDAAHASTRVGNWALTTALLLIALFWLFLILHFRQTSGWFGRIGFDFGCFWSATKAFLAAGPASAYDVEVVHQYGTKMASLAGLHNPETYTTGVSPILRPSFC